jgi:Ser/Thr protein kinase RdoA (MazF antagonist)
VRAALAVAAAQGLRVSAPRVLAEAGNVLVHLAPAPVVARVPTPGIAALRPGTAWLEREVAVAGHLARRGAPVVAPTADPDPGPHVHDGLPVTLWAYVPAATEPLQPRAAGRALREIHDALADFPGELPEHAIFHEARAVLARLAADGALAPADAALAERVGANLAARIAALEVPVQPLHGDAHLANVIQSPGGPLWNDFEDTHLGPRAWDLACLHAPARVFGRAPEPVAQAQDGYGDSGDAAVLELMIDARAYVGVAWTLVYAPYRADGADRVTARLAWLRGRER